MSITSGIWYFGTVSLDQDYTPSEKMISYLKKVNQELHIVLETGNSGKLHMHWIGVNTLRQDNYKSRVRKILEQDGYDVTNFSIDLSAEPNPMWRLGYLLKEEKRVTLCNTFRDASLEEANSIYQAKPKKERAEKQEKTMSKDKVAQYCADHGCVTRGEVLFCLKTLKTEGRITFSFYEKLNVKKLIMWCTEQFDDSINL